MTWSRARKRPFWYSSTRKAANNPHSEGHEYQANLESVLYILQQIYLKFILNILWYSYFTSNRLILFNYQLNFIIFIRSGHVSFVRKSSRPGSILFTNVTAVDPGRFFSRTGRFAKTVPKITVRTVFTTAQVPTNQNFSEVFILNFLWLNDCQRPGFAFWPIIFSMTGHDPDLIFGKL